MHGDGEFYSLAVAAGGVALGLAAAVWALAEHAALRAVRLRLTRLSARAGTAAQLREALLAESRIAVVVWDALGRCTLNLLDAENLLRACLDGPDGAGLSAALAALHRDGTAFVYAAYDPAGRLYAVRGKTAGNLAAVWLEPEGDATAQARRLAALLDAVPVPIWLRDASLSLKWANRAFLTAVGADTIETARSRRAALDCAEPDFAAAALAECAVRETGRYSLVRGVWRSFELTHVPLPGHEVAGIALDVSDVAETEIRLKRQIHNQAHVLDGFRTAIAMLGADRRLEAYNSSFVALWQLPHEWLDSRPTHDALLDRLREMRKLPERRDFQAWKNQRLALHAGGRDASEETWPLPDGRTLTVTFRNNPQGGATVLYEDVTEKFALESSLKIQVSTQAATLDALGEAVAVFGPDGRLGLHNAAFSAIWEFDSAVLAARPHVRDVADACQARFGDPVMWDRLAETVTSSPSQRRNWRKIHRSDGTVLSLTTMPLPDRATLVIFADITSHHGYEEASRERNQALETLERLRKDYIKQLSYELRTPLNTVLGFSEQLALAPEAAMDPQARERVEAVSAGAQALKSVVDGMLATLEEVGPVAARPDAAEPESAHITNERRSG